MDQLRDRGLQVVEATCPLVHHAHRALRKLVRDGCHPVIIGRRDHVEVRGMTEDLAEYDVVLEEEDLDCQMWARAFLEGAFDAWREIAAEVER